MYNYVSIALPREIWVIFLLSPLSLSLSLSLSHTHTQSNAPINILAHIWKYVSRIITK